MKILFHICCSNCTLYPFKILRSEGHDFAGFWYNPNIQPYEEYKYRLDSLRKLANIWNIDLLYTEEYKPEEYFNMFGYSGLIPEINPDDVQIIEQLAAIPSFPERCGSCYFLRLDKTAEQACMQGFDAFSTTLLISPYQNLERIVAVGNELAAKHNIPFYFKDFRPWFREAMNLARELELYRQKYCGCIFSRQERKKKKNQISA